MALELTEEASVTPSVTLSNTILYYSMGSAKASHVFSDSRIILDSTELLLLSWIHHNIHTQSVIPKAI